METILRTPEGKKIVIRPREDVCLHDAPHNPPNTGTRYISGTDLYAHKARSGKIYFYTYSWSMWQGSQDNYQLLTDEEAREFILHKAEGTGYEGLNDHDLAEEYFPHIFDEDA